MHHSKMSDHSKMSAAAQRPCVLQEVFAMTGGGIDPTDGFGNAWMLKPTVVEGKSFGDIYIGGYLCKQFLGKNFKMVEHIKNLRNKKVHELMQALSKEDDPNENMH